MADNKQVPKMRKPSRGRQKIEIKKIEQTSNRQVAFSKRRSGIFKKAGELAILCGAEVAVITMSERDRPFSFGHPNAEVVLNRFLRNSDSNINYIKRNGTASSHPHIRDLNKQYEEAVKELEEEKEKWVMGENGSEKSGDFFLSDVPTMNMGVDDLEDCIESLLELKHKVVSRMNELKYYYSFNPPPPLTMESIFGVNSLAPIMASPPPGFGGNQQFGYENFNSSEGNSTD